jgi:transcription termination factor Rho
MRTTMANDDIESGLIRSDDEGTVAAQDDAVRPAPENTRRENRPPPNTVRTRNGARDGGSAPSRDGANAPSGQEASPRRNEPSGDSAQASGEAGGDGSGMLVKSGVLEILPDGWGFLRSNNFDPGTQDIYVAQAQIKRFGLKTGDTVTGQVRPPKDTERFYGLLRVESVNSVSPEQAKARPNFEELVPIYPNERLMLETDPKNLTARVIDLIAPIGKGQRAIVVAPPKAGKTTILKSIANSITTNHPDVVLMVLLIDERPEEVTDIRRSVNGEVISSTFDELPENHMRVADMVLEKAKRLVESGQDVVILLDSLTRLSRASNLTVTPSGRTLQGGLDPAAIYRPKRFFGTARNIEYGGSLTIIATALVETGSRMDDIIFEEFKGTGNSELKLDREIANRRIFPAINVKESSTRKEELLYDEESLKAVYQLHRVLAGLDTVAATELLIDRLGNSKSNKEFLKTVSKTGRRDD